MLVLLAVCALLAPVRGRLDGDAVRMVGDFFGRQEVRSVAVLTCSDSDKLQLARGLAANGGLWTLLTGGPLDLTGSRMRTLHGRLAVFLHWDCPTAARILNESSALNMFNSSYIWLIWSEQLPPWSDFAHLNLRLDSDVTWAAGRPVQLFDLYRVHWGWPLNVTRAGSWDRDLGLRYTLQRGRNLQGATLRTGVVITKMPLNNLHRRLVDRENRHVDTNSKITYAVSLMLKDTMNFSMKLIPIRTWGYLKNGSFGGVIQMMQLGEVEFVASPFLLKEERIVAITYTGATYRFVAYFMFVHPPVLGVQSALISPFSGSVWLCLAGLLLLDILALQLVVKCEEHYGAGLLDKSWSGTIGMIFGAVCEQGTSMHAEWLSWRIITLSTFMLAELLYDYYSAAIVSSLLLPSPLTIRTLRDLVDSPLKVGLENLGYNKDYIEKTTDPLEQELVRRKIYSHSFMSVDKGVKLVARGGFAFFSEIVTQYPLLERELSDSSKCSLACISYMKNRMTYMSVPKGSPLWKMSCHGLRRIWETGLLQYHEKVWTPKRPSSISCGEVHAIGLLSLSPAFLVLMTGAVAAMLLLVMEWIHARSVRKKDRSSTRTTIMLQE